MRHYHHLPARHGRGGPRDFSRTSETIIFAPSETTKTVSFTATDDSTSEQTEVFPMDISGLSASEASIDSSTPADSTNFGSPYRIVRIQDNDNPANPSITIAPELLR